MRRYFTDDSLEDFLKQNADRFQMRPSDKVWQGISANLKRRNRRIGWIASLLLLLTSVSGYFLSQYQNGTGTHAGIAQRSSGSAATPASGARRSAAAAASALGSTTSGTATSTSSPAATNNPVTGTSANDLSIAVSNMDAANGRQQAAAGRPFLSEGSSTAGVTSRSRRNSNGRSGNPLRLAHSAYRSGSAPVASAQPVLPTEGYDPEGADHDRTNAALEEPALARVDLNEAPASAATAAAAIKISKPAKMSLQFFFTPTISYRKLSENKDFTSTTPQSSAAPNYAALYNINDAVTHKPNIGLEVGLTAKYPVARNLKVQGGLQFNMSRYDVHVFDNHWVNEAATMSLRDGRTAVSATPYSNFNGARRDWLQNLYFQVSVPVGFEVKLAGNDKTQFGIASTVQPTYLLSDRVFMLSTDYKNYVEVPWLMRRLNVNSSLTTYVTYSTGTVNWQMGPQIRYQLLSSFASKYPVKENLFDFGLRVGVTFKKSASGSKTRN